MKGIIITGTVIVSLLICKTGNSADRGSRFLDLNGTGQISQRDKGKEKKIGVNQFIGKWLCTPSNETVLIKPGGHWESRSADGTYHMKGRWRLENGALFWKNDEDPSAIDNVHVIISISENRFVLRKPKGDLVAYERIKD